MRLEFGVGDVVVRCVGNRRRVGLVRSISKTPPWRVTVETEYDGALHQELWDVEESSLVLTSGGEPVMGAPCLANTPTLLSMVFTGGSAAMDLFLGHHDRLKAAVALATSEGRVWALLSNEERDEYHRRASPKLAE